MVKISTHLWPFVTAFKTSKNRSPRSSEFQIPFYEVSAPSPEVMPLDVAETA